ncbi:MAG: hypothetical protein COW19_03685 [Zetaproteobacteria bacterium CG12_big_fil_rev_8_21_14_0_65_55_1124]|nr:MAG: hypothetical protein AUJ58_09095 [Zetaproteobacteria bacterium CG1_02_55_237]PIS18651.1 MAG: hypothetical protein COT53_09575 [Zetaproteobacteria bacterium CG08_land_8_20_14_0_20_55_17]PIW43256.1 MAG: hypothetical protein COW19_03685 [Zetaproteobacteria bacterium CG12_big_fil_rev_8_21_14_0_65_55_1124]PIY53386.1 MAG: hypothetical protein COZ01_03920 [Zetaproteobacteria bacterium CG_4_10_14_0_8_um_filter_55_43]PIZ38711.1 MAG: hypothetical protein COY36_05575 [Zetaproteobacteria bacterium 
MKVSISSRLLDKELYDGALNYAFIVHPRGVSDIVRAYPELVGVSEAAVIQQARTTNVHVLSPMTCNMDGRTLHGELLSIPYLAGEFREHLDEVRCALKEVIDYCEERHVRIAGLGALIPSVTRNGRLLADHSRSVGITTGHGFTAITIAATVLQVEAAMKGPVQIAVLGAAGSTGRSALRCLALDKKERNLTLVDRPSKRKVLQQLSKLFVTPVGIATDLDAIKDANLVVSVTNATTALLTPEYLSEGCVVIDDAQPENVSYETVLERPDITVIKCLASVPSLRCGFDYGLFPKNEVEAKQEFTFTCLAETIMLSGVNHQGHFTVGDPTEGHIRHLINLAGMYGIDIPPFHSFPEIGMIEKVGSGMRRRVRKFTDDFRPGKSDEVNA